MDVSAISPFGVRDASALLAGGPFAAVLARGGGLVVATGQPAHVVFATPAGLEMFGGRDFASLQSVIFGSRSPGARRLVQLARTLAPGGPARLERLRFFAGRSPLMLGLLCARLVGPNGSTYFVAAAARSGSGEWPRAELDAERPLSAADPAARIFASPPLDGPVRFLWTVDSEGRFGAPDSALTDRLGSNAPRTGESAEALRVRLPFDLSGAFVQALAARRTFSALRLDWPEPGLARARVALMSGAPKFDRERRFSGFQGFGVLTGESAPVAARPIAVRRPEEGRPPVPPAEPEASEPNPVEVAPVDGTGPSLSSFPGVLDSPTSDPEPSPAATAPTERPSVAPAPPSKPVREGGAEIFVLRPATPGQTAALNVVPIRPGVANAPTSPPGPVETHGAGEAEIVELSSQERDAFREIALALGARTRVAKPEREAAGSSGAPAEPTSAASEAADASSAADESTDAVSTASANRKSSAGDIGDTAALLDVLPIGALVLRGREAVYLNRTLLDLVGFADIEEFRAADGLEHIFRGRDPATFAPSGEGGGIPMVTASGELIAVDALTRPISWSGAPATLVAVRRSRDEEHQSRLRELEEQARLASARARDFAAALDLACDGMIRLDSAGRILAMSRRAERLFGYDQKEAAGEHFTLLLAPSSHAEAIARFAAAREGVDETGRFEVDAREPGGGSIPVQLAFGRLARAPEPEFCAVVSDLSPTKTAEREWRAARDKAERASALKSDFLARVSHEIRTPLHAILGFAEMIMEERFGSIGNDRYKDYVKDIHASGQHVMSLANDLLDLAKIEAGKMEFAFSPVDANRVIRECVALMQPQAARERIIVRLALFDKLPNVMADERALRQIILNLMSNAVKFNEPGGQVIVSTALDENGHPVIRVRDTGVGMDESQLSVALEPFRQVPGARRDDGAGLGLPLTKALAEANHADFSIKSRKEQGTLVEVAFPSVRAAQ